MERARDVEMSGDMLISPIERLCVEAIGADVATYLHSQLSNDIQSLSVGQSRYSFVLDPSGKIVALVRVSRFRDDAFLLDTDSVPGLGDILLARLNKFKIRVDVNFTVSIRSGVAVRSVEDRPISDSVREVLAGQSNLVVEAWWGDGRAVDVLPIADDAVVDIGKVAGGMGGSDISTRGLDEERVRNGWPAMGSEIVPGETLVAATGLVGIAVNFTKGCYPGQELVERMDSRGSSAPRTQRRIRVHELREATGKSTAVGEAIVIDGSEVGTVTSIAGEWALASVSRQFELGDLVSSPN
ncbi:MAG: YgfZ/GcvT domain-containing protein [Actinomycetota bacterium]